ncbi:hypothetical protein BJY00DRAFT_128764 [Aspergillus carlsbadensis]|nr:hypothetical protein BJY00DRAFT_128764 [Aspergillus carlsbadensis]
MAIKLAGDLSFYFLPVGFSFSSLLASSLARYYFSLSLPLSLIICLLSLHQTISLPSTCCSVSVSNILFCALILRHAPRTVRHQTSSLPWFLYQFLTFASY